MSSAGSKGVVRIGIVGTGWGTRVQAPVFGSVPGLKVTALCGRDKEKTEQLAKKLGIAFWTTDWRELVRHEEVDLISIVTPPKEHKEMAVAALAAGKHTLCDKPTALNAREAEEMWLQAQKLQGQTTPPVLAMIDHELRFLPSLQRVRERLVNQRVLGRLYSVEATFVTPMALHHDRNTWWYSKAEAGGILGAIGSHLIDALSWCTGSRVSQVCGTLTTLLPELEPASDPSPNMADNHVTVSLRFDSGVRGLLHISGSTPTQNAKRLAFYGQQGALFWDLNSGEVTQHMVDGTPQATQPPHPPATATVHSEPEEDYSVLPEGVAKNLFVLGTWHLAKEFEASASPASVASRAASFEDGLYVQRVIDAIHASNNSGSVWTSVEGVPMKKN